jgi:hypothetical protein
MNVFPADVIPVVAPARNGGGHASVLLQMGERQMPDPHRHNAPWWIRGLYKRHYDSDTTLGVAMALIAMLFIAGIVTAFIHAADTPSVQNAQTTAPASETTGSGSTRR